MTKQKMRHMTPRGRILELHGGRKERWTERLYRPEKGRLRDLEKDPGVPRRRGGSKWHVAFPDTRKLILSIGAKTSCPKREGGDQGSPRVTPQR